jgi:predicted transposase/invertase (TIGR01784 family)
MTIAQHLENRGFEKGAYETKFDVARNLLAMGMADDIVIKATKLSASEIKNLH